MVPSSPNKKTPAKKADKRMKMDHYLFMSIPHFERYKNFFLKGRYHTRKVCGLEDLRDTFIPNFFEGKGWDKMLSGLPAMCEPLIREDELSCWVKGT